MVRAKSGVIYFLMASLYDEELGCYMLDSIYSGDSLNLSHPKKRFEIVENVHTTFEDEEDVEIMGMNINMN